MFMRDKAEAFGKTMSRVGKWTTGLDTIHWLTIGSIVTSVALFAKGKKQAAIFVGLWPPTFQALKASMK